MSLTPSSFLHYWDSKHGDRALVSRGGLQHERAGFRRSPQRNGRIRLRDHDVLPWRHGEIDGVRKRLLWPQRAQPPVSQDSVLFDPGSSAWTAAGVASSAAVPSALNRLPTGGEARRFTGDGVGVAEVAQAVGTFSGGKEYVQAVVEGDTSATVEIGLWDATAAAWVARESYDFAADTLTTVDAGADAVLAEVVGQRSANGGPLVILTLVATGTSGNNREIRLRLDPAASGDSTILHQAELVEEAIVTDPRAYVGAPVANVGDQIYWDAGPPPQDIVWYVRYKAGTVVGDTGGFTRIMDQGDGDNPKMRFIEDDDAPQRILFHIRDLDDNSVFPLIEPNAVLGSTVDLIGAARISSDGSIRIIGSVDGGDTVVDDSITPASWTPPTSWGANNRIVLNERADLTGFGRSSLGYDRILALKAGDLDNDPFTAPAEDVYNEVAGVELTREYTVRTF